MSLLDELKYEQDGPSMDRIHVAAQAREPAPLPRLPAACVGTSLCQREMNR